MINRELTKVLHKCLDNKVKEVHLIQLIESFIIEPHYHFRYQDYEMGDVHQGIISQSFRNKLDKDIKLSKKQYPKKVWKHVKFAKHHDYPINNRKHTELSIKTRCEKSFKNGRGFFLFKRNRTILDRLYFILYISRGW